MFFSISNLYLGRIAKFYGGTGEKFERKGRNIPFFQSSRRECQQKIPKWLGSPQLHIFGLKAPLSYKIWEGGVENNTF